MEIAYKPDNRSTPEIIHSIRGMMDLPDSVYRVSSIDEAIKYIVAPFIIQRHTKGKSLTITVYSECGEWIGVCACVDKSQHGCGGYYPYDEGGDQSVRGILKAIEMALKAEL